MRETATTCEDEQKQQQQLQPEQSQQQDKKNQPPTNEVSAGITIAIPSPNELEPTKQIECDESSVETTEGDLEVAEILATPIEPQRVHQMVNKNCLLIFFRKAYLLSISLQNSNANI